MSGNVRIQWQAKQHRDNQREFHFKWVGIAGWHVAGDAASELG